MKEVCKEKKMKLLSLLHFLLLFAFSGMLSAEVKKFHSPSLLPPDSSIALSLPFSLGTHKGLVSALTGKLLFDPMNLSLTRGEFTVALHSISTQKAERDCHLMESLGLDYDESDFPEKHVCNKNDELPLTGKNAIKYPDIRLIIHSLKSTDTGQILWYNNELNVEVDGEWTIHGKSFRSHFPMKMISEGTRYRVRGEVPFSLKQYDIIVKPTKILFMEIKVEDLIKVNFDVVLEPDLN